MSNSIEPAVNPKNSIMTFGEFNQQAQTADVFQQVAEEVAGEQKKMLSIYSPVNDLAPAKCSRRSGGSTGKLKKEMVVLSVPVLIEYENPAGRDYLIQRVKSEVAFELSGISSETGHYRGKLQNEAARVFQPRET